MGLRWKTIGIGLLLCFVFVVLPVTSWGKNTAVPGQPPGPVLKIEGRAAVLMEPVTGEVIFAKNATERLPPASVTKLMVMLLTLEAIDKGQIKITDVITASPEACKMGGSQIWLEPGEKMTVAELLKAVCIVSANDASYALGEHLAGSEENFVALMNKRAQELGLSNTHYVNTTGLEPSGGGEGNYTSALDMARLAREVIKYPMVYKWSGVWIDSLRDGKSFLRNTNRLVRFYRGCDGLKTGFTAQAGFCLVATAKRDGVRMIAVVMKSPKDETRARDIASLFNYGFSRYKAYQVYKGGETVGRVRVFRGQSEWVTAVVPRELTAILKREEQGEVIKTTHFNLLIHAPVAAGAKVGEVSLTFQGKPCGQIDLVAGTSVKRASVFGIWKQIWRHMMHTATH